MLMAKTKVRSRSSLHGRVVICRHPIDLGVKVGVSRLLMQPVPLAGGW
jgi:hypothetical protein